MIKLKGTTLYPPAINDVLDNTSYVQNYVVYVRNSESGTDEVLVKVGLNDDVINSHPTLSKHPERVVSELKNRFRAHLRVAPIVEVCPVGEIQKINFPPKTRKPIKFIDQR